MSREPILTLGELEPERPLVAINRRIPDGAWQHWKHRHLEWLLRWFPVRYRYGRELYALRTPQEFGLSTISRIQRFHAEFVRLQDEEDPASLRRASKVMGEVVSMILDAPAEVIDELPDGARVRLLMAFPAAVAGPPEPEASPLISPASSPASAVSTAPTSG